jgi:hypothetical protein
MAMVSIIGAGLTVSAFGLLDMNKRGGFGVELPAKSAASLFKPNYDSASTRGLPGGGSGGPTALELAYKANQGAFGEPSAPAAKDEGKTQDAAASADKASDGSPVPPGIDPAAIAQQMAAGAGGDAQGGAKMGTAGYGKLSSGMGGLSGGGGMSGGIAGSFQQPKLSNSAMGQATAFNRGAKAKVTRGMTAVGNKGPLSLKGAQARRLQRMEQAMGASKKSNAEMAAATQSQQWTNSQPAGQGIQGAGVSSPGGGQFADDGPGASEGPVESAPTANPPATEPPPVDGGKNVTPYQSQVDMAVMLLMAACVLNLIAFALGVIANSTDWLAGAGEAVRAIASALCYIAAALGAIVCLLGVAIASSGQVGQGLIFTVTGGLVAALSYVSASGIAEGVTNPALVSSTSVITSGISAALGGIGAGVGSATGGGGEKK